MTPARSPIGPTGGVERPRERGIIFTGANVRAIMAGTKVQTRRVLKPQPEQFAVDDKGTLCDVGLMQVEGDPWPRVTNGRVITLQEVRFAVGQRLWVREGCATIGATVVYRAGHEEERGRGPRVDVCWRSPIHMPRWASRLTLAVTDVRVQRLQDIIEADAIEEGITQILDGSDANGCWTYDGMVDFVGCWNARGAYRALWNSIHGSGAWDENPWVAAISFERVAVLPTPLATTEAGR